MNDQLYMGMALSLAQTAARLGETPVGCVIVDEATGEVLSGAANGPIGMTDPTAHAEVKRIGLLNDTLRQKLAASGRFEIVDMPPDVTREIASAPRIDSCNGCRRELTRRSGASWAAWGTVQKVSNLILNINVFMENSDSGKMEFIRSVDIRGNTDESWQRGLDYLLRNYLLHEP